MEWYGAFGIMVTLVWLYLEILRFSRRCGAGIDFDFQRIFVEIGAALLTIDPTWLRASGAFILFSIRQHAS